MNHKFKQILSAPMKPDPTFPHGIPNPLLAENQRMTSEIVQRERQILVLFSMVTLTAVFFDEQGAFIEGEYMVGLLAECFLSKYKGVSIVYDPRVVWNVVNKISLLAVAQFCQNRPYKYKTNNAKQ